MALYVAAGLWVFLGTAKGGWKGDFYGRVPGSLAGTPSLAIEGARAPSQPASLEVRRPELEKKKKIRKRVILKD